jgi:NAD-dependent histone deacetylase SIR2
MGNEESTMVDPSTKPVTLSARTAEALAKYIKEGKARKIIVLVRQQALHCTVSTVY